MRLCFFSAVSLETATICLEDPHPHHQHHGEPVPTLPVPQTAWILMARATRGDASLNVGFIFLAHDTQDLDVAFSACFEIGGDSLNVYHGKIYLT